VLTGTFGGVRDGEALPCTKRSLMIGILHQMLSGDRIRWNEMDWACGTDEEEDKFIKDFGGKCVIEWTTGGTRH